MINFLVRRLNELIIQATQFDLIIEERKVLLDM